MDANINIELVLVFSSFWKLSFKYPDWFELDWHIKVSNV
jgi:hypothetical protein